MQIARGMLVVMTAVGIIGAAQANAPGLELGFLAETGSNLGLTAPAVYAATHNALPGLTAPSIDRSAAGFIKPGSTQLEASSTDPRAQSTPQRRETALMVLVGIGLIAYQLRRKHRFLRPHAIALNS